MLHPAMIALLRAADVVIDAYPVGAGLVVAEALMAGTPVITVRTAQVRAALLHRVSSCSFLMVANGGGCGMCVCACVCVCVCAARRSR
jgi:predicted O-linked N-acetylglucosamine transferase (SPINDLY family)